MGPKDKAHALGRHSRHSPFSCFRRKSVQRDLGLSVKSLLRDFFLLSLDASKDRLGCRRAAGGLLSTTSLGCGSTPRRLDDRSVPASSGIPPRRHETARTELVSCISAKVVAAGLAEVQASPNLSYCGSMPSESQAASASLELFQLTRSLSLRLVSSCSLPPVFPFATSLFLARLRAMHHFLIPPAGVCDRRCWAHLLSTCTILLSI